MSMTSMLPPHSAMPGDILPDCIVTSSPTTAYGKLPSRCGRNIADSFFEILRQLGGNRTSSHMLFDKWQAGVNHNLISGD